MNHGRPDIWVSHNGTMRCVLCAEFFVHSLIDMRAPVRDQCAECDVRGPVICAECVSRMGERDGLRPRDKSVKEREWTESAKAYIAKHLEEHVGRQE